METHKWVIALDKGKGVTYLSGENQQSACWLPVAKPLCTSTGDNSYTREVWRKVILATGHIGGVLDTLEGVTHGRRGNSRPYLCDCFSRLMISQ